MELKNLLLNLKLYGTKVLVFIQHYWAIILLALVLVAVLLFANNKEQAIKKLVEEFQNKQKDRDKIIADLQGQIEEEIKKRQEIEKQYNDLITKINKDHDKGIQDIATTKEKEIKEIIKRNQDDPNAMATGLNQLFGIQVVQMREIP